MTNRLLILVAVLQGFLLGALSLLILLNRWVQARRRARLDPLRLAVGESIRRWVIGAGDAGAVLAALRRLPIPVAIEQLTTWAGRIPGDRWQELAHQLALERWVQLARNYAESSQWWRRLECARFLSVAAIPEDAPRVLKLLRDGHPAVHLAAVSVLGRLKTPELAEAALERLPHLTPTVRAYYDDVLQRSGTLLVELLRARLSQPADPALASFAELAARLEEPALRPPLTALAGHPDAEIRISIARALGSFPHPDSVAALNRLAADAAWEVRAQAIRSLGRIGDPGCLELVQRALGDPEWWVRLRAGLALARLGAPGRNALLHEEVGPRPPARDMARLILGLSQQALAEFSA